MLRIKKIILCIIFISSVSTAVYPDITIEEKITTTMTEKPFHGVRKTYIAKDKTLLDDPTIAKKIIFDYNANKVYVIEDAKKDISIYASGNFKLPYNERIYGEFVNLEPEDVLSKESGIKKKIGNYHCHEVVIYIPKIAALARIWLTKDIEAPLSPYLSFLEQNSDIIIKKLMPAMKAGNLYIAESATIIIRPKTAEKNLKIELIKFSAGEIPESIFKLPEGYRKLNIE
ncbi:MAG: hypothetical protein V1874_17675 [Spirochaetota bacterium]